MHGAFVTSGCLRKYVVDAKGKEHIVQFAPENWWVGEGPGVAAGMPSMYFIDAVEDSSLLRRSNFFASLMLPGARSIPVTRKPFAARHVAWRPVPHPRSSTRAPRRGSSNAISVSRNRAASVSSLYAYGL